MFASRSVGNEPDTQVRRPARAGQFYPGDEASIAAELDRHFAQAGDIEARPLRAVMLPHAGWMFCGDTIGKTLALAHVPDTVVVVSPKHTPFGPTWSVASHDTWALPGDEVPIDDEVRGQLLDQVPELEAEEAAHLREHGVEVLTPFLRRMNPDVRIVPLVIGNVSYADTAGLARALANVVAETDTPPLLVISSDMNHFETEPVNRELDHRAIEAMTTGDPRQLYNTCAEHRISMCGLLPAVTVMQALREQSGSVAPELIDYRNSAAVSSDISSVVGYAGMILP